VLFKLLLDKLFERGIGIGTDTPGVSIIYTNGKKKCNKTLINQLKRNK
jgi:hypothetical protein